MKHTDKLYEDLRALGIQNGDTVLVHTSIKGLQKEGLTASEVIDALLIAVGDGTLLVPALSYLSVTKDTPLFDVANTKTCIGVVPEVFRTTYATHRSVHPTHSVCAKGRLAASITAAHKLDKTPVGEHSPFRLLVTVGGKILMLGCGLKPNTFMHGVEEAAEASYPLLKETVAYTITDKNTTYNKNYYPHEFGSLIQRYDRLEGLLAEPYLVKGNALNGTAYLIDAAKAMEVATIAIRKNDDFFVDEQ